MILAALLLLAHTDSVAQAGNYHGARWHVNSQRTLHWNGIPYVPIGWRMPASAPAIRAVPQTGVSDVLLELAPNEDWNAPIAAAEESKLHYLITLSGDAPRAPAFIIRPEMYRIDRVVNRETYTIPLPGIKSAYYILITSKGFHVESKGWLNIVNDVAQVQVNQTVVSESYTILIYPRVDSSELTDYWERFDARRDALLKQLRNTNFGEGLRGIVSPLGSVQRYTAYEGGIVPDSELFRLEFQGYLEEKYRNDIDLLSRAWRLRGPDIDTFAQAARLIPLFSRTRGIDSLFDPQEERFVPVDFYNSNYWLDLQTVIDNAATRRLSRLAESIRRQVDVPVVYEWSGWSPVYDSRKPAGNGIGIRAIGSGLAVIEEFASRPVSSAVAWQNSGWLIATDLRGGPNFEPFPDAKALATVVHDLSLLGAKGWFVRWTAGPESEWLSDVAKTVKSDESLVNRSVRAIFFPENARYPANTMRLPGGVWWLPTPAAGNRLDLGRGYEAYRHVAPYATFTAIWRTDAPKKTKLLFANTSNIEIRSADGQLVDAKVVRDGIELTVDTVPILVFGTDDIPVPQDTVEAIQAEYRLVTSMPQGRALGTGDFRFLFEDSVKRLKQNPSGAYVSMVDSLRNIQRQMGIFEWIEAESADETTFGHVYSSPACSGERALGVDTPIPPGPDGYTATFSVRLDEGEREVWVAAKLDADLLPFLELEIANTTRTVVSPGLGGYGPGFAWYSFGKINPRGGVYTITLRLKKGAPHYRMSVDALLLTKRPFVPRGPRMPSVG